MVKLKRTLLLLIAMVFFGTSLASAQENASTGTANGMRVSPTRTELSLRPGEQKDFSVTVTNVAEVNLRLRSDINDFESDGITGTPQIIVAENRQVPTSLKDYITGLGTLELAPGESKEIPFSIDLPEDATAGVYYGAIRFSVIPGEGNEAQDTTQVSLNASVASLVFVEVPGEIVEKMTVDTIRLCQLSLSQSVNVDPNTSPQGTGIQQYCEKGSSFFVSPPNVSSIQISNDGTGFLRPFGRVVVKKGSTEVFSYELNNSEPRGLVLPASSRVFSNEIKNISGFGRYTVEASVSYGQGGEVVVKRASFWYVPVPILIIGLLILAVVLVGGFVVYRRLRASGSRRRK